MCTLLAKIQIHPGKESEFESVMAFMYVQTHGTETEVQRYEYWRGREPGFYYCLLSFPSNLAFWQHQASDHHAGKMQQFAACIAELDLEVVDPVASASPLTATNEETPANDLPIAVLEQAKAFPIKLAEWWLALR